MALRVFAEFADRLAGHELAMVLAGDDQAGLDALAARLAVLRARRPACPSGPQTT